MQSSLSLDPSHPTPNDASGSNSQLLIIAPLLVLLQWFLSVLHTPQVLPRIGVQTFVYIGSMISLGVFFAGLGVWEGIV